MSDKVKWGVLGAATIAINRVIPATQETPNAEFVALASRDLEKGRAAAAKVGIPKVYGSYEALLADPDIEAVFIPLPNNLHVEWCIKALEAGKHVLCEKPLAMTAKEAEALIPARDKAGKLLEEGYAVRNHPQWAAMREVLESGEIGAPRNLYVKMVINNRDPNNIRNRADVGGGALYDLGCYMVLAARTMFAQEPTRVIGQFEMDPAFGIDRLASALLDFPGGQAAFQTAMQAGTVGATHQQFEIVGEKGWMRADFAFAHPAPTEANVFIGHERSYGNQHARVMTFPPCNQYGLQAERFSRLVRGEKVNAYPIEDSIANMRVLDAIRRTRESARWENV